MAEREGLLYTPDRWIFQAGAWQLQALVFPLCKMEAIVNSTLVVKGILGRWMSTVVSMEPRIMPDP